MNIACSFQRPSSLNRIQLEISPSWQLRPKLKAISESDAMRRF